MKILTVGDPHWKSSNVKIMPVFEKELFRVIEKTSPDVVVFLGDMLDRHEIVNTDIMNECHSFIERVSEVIETIVIIGNHDQANNRVFLEPRHAFNALKKLPNITIVDKPYRHPSGEFVAVPYVPAGRFAEAMQGVDLSGCRFVFCHQEFAGAMFNGCESAVTETYPKDFPIGISGHIHARQKLAKNFYYIGTPFQQDFGDTDEKSISLLTTGEKVSETTITLKIPRRITVNLSYDQVMEWNRPEGDDIYRVVVGCQCSDWISLRKSSHYKDLITQGVKVVPVTINTETASVKSSRKNYLESLREAVIGCNDPLLLEEYNSMRESK